MNSELIEEAYAAVAEAEKLLARGIERGAGELVPLLADVQALAAGPFDARFRKAVEGLNDAFPYHQDKGETWVCRSDARFVARLRSAGVGYGDTSDSSIREVAAALGKIRHFTERALSMPPSGSRTGARAASNQRTLDVGRHRLHFLAAEDGGGFVIDDGWYVPVGEARAALAAGALPERDYVLVATAPCPATRSSGGLCLVDARSYRWSRVTTTPVALETALLGAEGLSLGSAGPVVPYDTLSSLPALGAEWGWASQPVGPS